MLRNYLKIAFRSLTKNKGFTFINLTGLAVGMACCLLIGLYIQDELSYDRYHEKAERTYRVLQVFRMGDAADNTTPPSPEDYQVWGTAPVGPALAADFPEIEQVVQFTSHKGFLLQHGEKRFQENQVLFMDPTVFDVFSWKLLKGNSHSALVAPNSVVLTKSTAEKYFGSSNPMGQTILLDNESPVTVTGVMEDVPQNSHFTFDVLLSMSTFRQARPSIFESWGYVDFYTYFTLAEGAEIASLKEKIPQFMKRHVPEEERGFTMALEPMTDAYLHSQATSVPGPTGNLSNVYIFSSIAVFILLLACINFMNLTTARSTERAKEIGVRKVIGASRGGLVYQFLTESTLLSLLAAVLALVLAWISFPLFRELSGKAFTHEKLFSPEVLGLMAIAVALVGVLAGSYPAWVLTRFKPALVLKGAFKSSSSGILLRKGLVVFQFSLSMALIVGTAVVYLQLEHLLTKDLGFRQEQMLVIDYGYDEAVNQKIELIKSQLSRHPDVHSASAARFVPGDFKVFAGTTLETPRGDMKGDISNIYEIDYDFLAQYEIELAAGRGFSRDFPADTARSLILNEAAAKQYGYTNPADAVGKRFSQWGREGMVVGVVRDFNFRSLHSQVEPLTLRMANSGGKSKLSLRIQSDNLSATLQELEQIWSQLVPHYPFLYSFLDDSFNQQYKADLRFGKVFGVFAGIAICIACLGLLGLVTYTAQQRTKEIGIRKVLGASVISIVTLLSQDFLKLVAAAALIAFPLAWYAMEGWLQDFPYRVDLPFWIFLASGAVAALIAFLTISYQALKAARSNPVENLRSE